MRHTATSGSVLNTSTTSISKPTSFRPHSRVFARLCLGSAVITASALGGSVYLSLASIALSSTDPFAVPLGWLVVAKLAAIVALLMVPLSIVACLLSRPRATAVLALTTSIALPVAAAGLGVALGVRALQGNMTENLSSLADTAVVATDLLQSWGVSAQPVRDLAGAVRKAGQ